MTIDDTSRRTSRRLGVVLATALAAAWPAACSDGGPGATGPGGSGSTPGSSTSLPAPYGDDLEVTGSPEHRCGVGIDEITDTYVDAPLERPGTMGHGPTADGPAAIRAVGSGAPPAAGTRAAGRPASERALVPPIEGVVDRVTVEVVSPPSGPAVELDITLTGSDEDDEFLVEGADVSFISVDEPQRWVGFVAVDGELTGHVPFDAPISPAPGGRTARIEVVPVACPADGVAGRVTAEPLPDGRYELSIHGAAPRAEPAEDDPHGHVIWGQERTVVTVSDGVLTGIGYDGPNAYSR